jgi:hypothetical protein
MSDTPAFPSPNNVVIGDMKTAGHSGMSLRDWFAGQALAGIAGNAALLAELDTVASMTNKSEMGVVTGLAFNMADAMLAERAKGGAA